MSAPSALQRRRLFNFAHRCHPPLQRSTAPLPCIRDPFVSVEFARDAVRPPHPSLCNSTCSSTSSSICLSFREPQLLPFRPLLLATRHQAASLSLTGLHTLLFTALSASPDVRLQKQCGPSVFGGIAAAELACVEMVFGAIRRGLSVASVSPVTYHPLENGQLLLHIRLAWLLFLDAPNTAAAAALELNHVQTCPLPPLVLYSLLAIPCDPLALKTLLQHALYPRGAEGFAVVDAALFQGVVMALLNNDNFFRRESFSAMHRLLMEVALPALKSREDIHPPNTNSCSSSRCTSYNNSSAFDYLSVRWTPLLKKWARVYGKGAHGFELQDCCMALLAAVPAVETKMPSSFLLRVMGSVLDASSTAAVDVASVGWERMTQLGRLATRLFGRNAADLHSIWVLLIKAALTLPPIRLDAQRLLEAYHTCAAQGREIEMDRGAFMQVLRLTSAAVGRGTAQDAALLVDYFCRFMTEQEGVSFLWLLDGVGVLLTDLWAVHGLSARPQAVQLSEAMAHVLQRRVVAGVSLQNNPMISHAMEQFQVGPTAAFWWICGCGESLPASSQRCTSCLRRSGASWSCPGCHLPQSLPSRVQRCSCGVSNPRQLAAQASGCNLCDTCGAVQTAPGVCPTCELHAGDAQRDVVCRNCASLYRGAALHCPKCFEPHPDKPLALWKCDRCQHLNYSVWSSCQSCGASRRRGALRFSFLPWPCGCGSLQHPCRMACAACSGKTGEKVAYTCPQCRTVVAGPTRTITPCIPDAAIPLHLCPHCSCVHPRDEMLLHAPSLQRHCMQCANPARALSHPTTARAAVFHCGVWQTVGEYVPFVCTRCHHTEELQMGFHCRHCLFPRPELAQQQGEASEAGTASYYVWRCLHESNDGDFCGRWNYSWCSQCLSCGNGRPNSAYECRAKALIWVCARCHQTNRPIDLLVCPGCGEGAQSVPPCSACGLPHLSYACLTGE